MCGINITRTHSIALHEVEYLIYNSVNEPSSTNEPSSLLTSGPVRGAGGLFYSWDEN